jgi:hypothetical protein
MRRDALATCYLPELLSTAVSIADRSVVRATGLMR